MTSNNQEFFTMDKIEISLHENTCPNCGVRLVDKRPVGTGNPADGRFCSFDCFMAFNPFISTSGRGPPE